MQIALNIAGLDTTEHDSMFVGKFDTSILSKNSIMLNNVVVGSNWATLADKSDMFHLFVGRIYTMISGGTVHLSVKHKNTGDFLLTAEVALINAPKFIKGEFLGVGTGSRQYLTLAQKNNVQPYDFCLYFNGVEQEKDDDTDVLAVNAASGEEISVSYAYRGEEYEIGYFAATFDE